MSNSPSPNESHLNLQRPSVFAYLNYRLFIRDFIEFLKTRKEYSARGFAREAGLGSPSYIKMILDGKRELGTEGARKLSRAFNLKILETDFFRTLVEFNLTDEAREKDRLFQKLLKFKQFKEIHRLQADTYEYFSNWRMITIYEAVSTDWNQLSESEQANSLSMEVHELQEAFKRLEKINLIQKEGNKWIKKTDSFITPLDTHSLMIRQFHRQMAQKALDSIDLDAPDTRSMVGITIALSERNKRELRQRIFEFVQEMNARYAQDTEAVEVLQFNLQLFPLLNLKK